MPLLFAMTPRSYAMSMKEALQTGLGVQKELLGRLFPRSIKYFAYSMCLLKLWVNPASGLEQPVFQVESTAFILFCWDGPRRKPSFNK